MQLSELLSICGSGIGIDEIDLINGGGSHQNLASAGIEISSLEYDSREVRPGAAFFALPGVHTDGHLHVQQAVERGAVLVFCERDPLMGGWSSPRTSQAPAPPFIRVENCRIMLSRASAAFFNNPAKELIVIGVTGTDGKSSTVSFLHQLLEASSIPSGFISTVSIRSGSKTYDNKLRQSTPEAPDIHRLLREMVEAGKLVAIVESTSHGLSDKTARLYSLEYDAAIFTNIDHEHLDFHGSFEQYLFDKANLFRRLRQVDVRKLQQARSLAGQAHAGQAQPADSGAPIAVINKNDRQFFELSKIAEERGAVVRGFQTIENPPSGTGSSTGSAPASGLGTGTAPSHSSGQGGSADQISSHADRNDFRLSMAEQTVQVALPIPGIFNVENVLACAVMLHYFFGIGPETIAENIKKLRPLRGRMLPIYEGQNFDVLLDYAHTPGSFRRLFPILRASCRKRIIALFGSAGERDLDKRPIQGAIAAEYADIIILTNEDPRLEDPMAIIDDIARGAEDSGCSIHKIPDRRRAIEQAMEIAEEGDMLVSLGKGHEASVILRDGKIPWDEEAELRTALRAVLDRQNGRPAPDE